MESTKQNQLVKSLFAGVLLFIFCGWLSCMQAKADDTVTFPMTGTYAQTNARSMLDLLNTYRTSPGVWCLDSDGNKNTEYYKNLSPLVYDYELEKCAMQRAMEVAVYFSHTRPNGELFNSVDSADYSIISENIAAASNSAEQVFNLWLEENMDYDGQGHRRNMLDPYHTSIGIGAVTRNGMTYWVQLFGSSDNTGTPTAANNETATLQIDVDKSYINAAYCLLADGSKRITVSQGDEKVLPEIVVAIALDEAFPEDSALIPVPDTFSWSVTDPSVASLSGGLIKGLKKGTTTLTSSYEGRTVSVNVTVTKATLASLIKSENIISITKAPASVKAKAKKGRVTISWKKIAKNKKGKKLLKNIQKVQVQYSTSPSFSGKPANKLLGKSKNKVTLKLKRKTIYYVRVRYIGSDGTSRWSKVKKVRTK